ncbi:MAG TPA: type IV pilus secretin PilQ [Burkholderiaceae bacterium]|nr:type IV pilus secretin PilQ [Burkholderiaceae bacterium]
MKNPKENRMSMINWRSWSLALALAVGTPAASWAQGVIQSISSSQQGGGDVVRVELSEALKAVPSGFVIQQPPRIAIDLPGVGSALGRPTVDINAGNLRSVAVAQAGDRTRVVLNLKQAAAYRAQLDGKALVIVVESAATAGSTAVAAAPAAAAAPATATPFAPSQNREQLALKDIDFRRGVDGSGRVIVTLPSSQMGVDIRQQGASLLVEFPRAAVPDSMRRRLDVTDFGTPIQTITTTQSGDRVRMLIEPRGNWEHSAYQSDTQFVVEVRPVRVDPNKLTQGPGYQGEKLSLNFQNIEVRSLLQVIADFTNFNVVTSDTVGGSLTLRLKDVPWDQALDIILQAKGLGMRKSGNVIWIAPKDEIAIKENAELEAGKKKTELEPLRTQGFQLNYTKAEDVAKGLVGTGSSGGQGGTTSRILSPRGSVLSEQRTNQLFVTDIPSKLEEIQQLIAKIDIPVRQVMIEARIVEANDSFGKSLGVKLGGRFVNDPGGVIGRPRGTFAPTIDVSQPAGGIATVTSSGNFVNLPAVGQGGYDPASFSLALFNRDASRFINLEISALEADGKGKIVSSPRIVTADQIKASISQGTKIPFQKSTSSGATSVEFIEASLKLEVTPQITPEGNVILDVKVNKDSLGTLTALGREINVKEIKTNVLVENGGTVVIGGIFEQNESTNVTKVPLLGDVPFLGNLFKTTTKDTSRTELLVFLTPRVVTEKAMTR